MTGRSCVVHLRLSEDKPSRTASVCVELRDFARASLILATTEADLADDLGKHTKNGVSSEYCTKSL